MTTQFKNVCPLDCPDTCSMLVTVEDGVAVDLRGDPDHPFTRGFLCQKMARYLDRVYSPDRLLHPLRRVGPKGEGRFERIGWDEALDDDRRAVRRDRRVGRRPAGDPALQLLRDDGQAPVEQPRPAVLPPPRAPRCSTGRSAPRPARSATSTRSAAAGSGPTRWPCPSCKFIVNWGSNTANTNSHLWSLMIEARKRGRDDRHDRPLPEPDRRAAPTGTSSPGPGTDAALALGLMHVIWRDGLQDDDYLGRGDRRRRPAPRPRPRRVPARTRRRDHRASTSTTIDDASPAGYAREQPSLIRLNYGLQRHHGGGMAVRTIACLPAIVGSWRHHGGGALLSTSGTYDFAMDRLTRPDLVAARHPRPST